MKVLIGGILAGLVVFVWGAISHMVLPTGEMGIKSLPNEESIVGAMRAGITESGLYFFPGIGDGERTKAQMEEWESKLKAGPTGILVYTAGAGAVLAPAQLFNELLSNILAALIAAFVLAKVAGTYGSRVIIVGLMGLFAWFSLSVSYWNWYKFPAEFICAEAIDQVIGWTLAGLVLAKVVKPAPVT